jgi:hypothetical protein
MRKPSKIDFYLSLAAVALISMLEDATWRFTKENCQGFFGFFRNSKALLWMKRWIGERWRVERG